ncbi:MAG: S8 family serine peptidase [Planctomycetota bacterium]
MRECRRVVVGSVVGLALSAPAMAQNPFGYGGDTSRPAPMPDKPAWTQVDPGHQQRVLQLKFASGTDVRVREGWFHGSAPEIEELNGLLVDAGARPRRMFQQSEEWLAAWRASGEARSGIALHDLNLFYYVDVDDDHVTGALCDALNGFDVVRLAWPAPSGGDPVLPPSALPVGPPALGGTPNYESFQGYKAAAPNGVDSIYGNTFSGGRGIGTLIVDVETGWTDDHEDIINKAEDQFAVWIPANYPWDHGTAVLGELVAEDNGFGMRGIVWEADVMMSTHTPVGLPQDIAGGIANGAAASTPGGALVLEVQCYGGAPDPFPCEYDPAIFATVQTVTANGVHVYAAAGNGSHNLDSFSYGGAFDLGVKDSGAIMIGATDGGSLATASFSNYGSRVSSNGWGYDVATLAYGDLQGGPAVQEYTDIFSGTSSATPIVTGAGVALNAMHREAFGTDIDPLTMRSLLESTGTPQTSGGDIGTRPDMRTAVRQLGIPEIQVGGNLVEGGQVDVTSYGDPGDAYVLFWSPNLVTEGTYVPPFGYFYLDPLLFNVLPTQGSIGVGGMTSDSYEVPTGLGLAGVTSFLQGLQIFASKPGSGSFSNYADFRIL